MSGPGANVPEDFDPNDFHVPKTPDGDPMPVLLQVIESDEHHPYVADDRSWHIRTTVDPDDEAQVRDLIAAEWGTSDHDIIDGACGGDASATCAVAKTYPDGDVIGVGIWGYHKPRDAEGHLEPANIDCSAATRCSLLHLLAVDADWQREGIGTALVDYWLWQSQTAYDVDYVVTVSWHRDDHPDSSSLFEHHGLQPIQTIDEKFYWTATWKRTTCPDCSGICTCGASIYSAPVTEVDDAGP